VALGRAALVSLECIGRHTAASVPTTTAIVATRIPVASRLRDSFGLRGFIFVSLPFAAYSWPRNDKVGAQGLAHDGRIGSRAAENYASWRYQPVGSLRRIVIVRSSTAR